MVAKRLTVSLDPGLAQALRDAAERDGTTISAWVAEAVDGRLARQINLEGLAAVIADWEAEHGAFTPEEMEQARQDLGW